MSGQSSSSGGVGFLGLLTVLFIGLKLTGHIDWSWWLVLAPTLAPAAFMLLVFVVWFFSTALSEARKGSRK